MVFKFLIVTHLETLVKLVMRLDMSFIASIKILISNK